MPKPAWTTVEQYEWLAARIPSFLDAQKKLDNKARSKNSLKAFFAPIQTEWEKKWPYPNPTPGELKDAGNDIEVAKARVRKVHIDRVYYWFFNHTRDTGGSGGSGGSKNVFKVAKPRRLQAYLVYAKLYKDTLKPIVDGKWNEHIKSVPPEKQQTRIAFTTQIYHQQWEAADADVKSKVEEERNKLFAGSSIDLDFDTDDEDNGDDEGAEGKREDAEIKKNKMLREMQLAVDQLPAAAKTLLASFSARTGWPCTLLTGGPQPKRGGKLKMYCFHEGVTKDTGEEFDEATDDYEEKIVDTYDEFIQRCFPEDMCLKLALPGTSKDNSPQPSDKAESAAPEPSKSAATTKSKSKSNSSSSDQRHNGTTPSQATSVTTPSQATGVTTPSQATGVTTPSQATSTTPSQDTGVTPSETTSTNPSDADGVTPSQATGTNPSDDGVTPSETTSTDLSDADGVTPSQATGANPSEITSTNPSDADGVTPSQPTGTTPSEGIMGDEKCDGEREGGGHEDPGIEGSEGGDADMEPGPLLDDVSTARITRSARKPPPLNSKATTWHNVAIAHFLKANKSAEVKVWTDLVHFWAGIEYLLGYPTASQQKHRLTAKQRLPELKHWLSEGKKLSTTPQFNVKEYAVAWRSWWEFLQPAWRESETWPPVREVPADEDWASLRRGGPNGIFHILVTLSWWSGKCLTTHDRDAYVSAQEDVKWVFEQIYFSLEDQNRSEKSTSATSSSKRGRKQVPDNANKRRRIGAD